MATQLHPVRILRFGIFEVDIHARELRKGGLKLKLHEQPFQVLLALLERPGEVVTREELRQKLWPGGTFVDFDHSLNTAVNKIREVLGDSADTPRFVETLARRGYRFLASVDYWAAKPAVTTEPVAEVTRLSPVAPARGRLILPWALFAAASLVLITLAAAYFYQRPDFYQRPGEVHTVRFQLPLPEKASFEDFDFPAISPDGQRVVIPGIAPDGQRRLWIRSLDSSLDSSTDQMLPVSGDTEFPFWSPDSRFVAFVDETDSKIKKIDVTGGQPQTVSRIPGYAQGGGTWSQDGSILFSLGCRLYRMPSGGGEATLILPLDKSRKERAQLFPHFLPDGRHFLYTSLSDGRKGGVYLGSLDFQETRMLIPARSNATYVPPGFVVYGRGETLLAQRFDAETLRVKGEPFSVEEKVGRKHNLYSQFSSTGGVLIYRGAESSKSQLGWYGRDGSRLGFIGEPEVYEDIAMAPDETRLAVQRPDSLSETSDIWILKLSSGIFSRVTAHTDRDLPAENSNPIWSASGRELIFSSGRKGEFDLYRKALDGGDEQLLFESNIFKFAEQGLQDGSILFRTVCPPLKNCFSLLPAAGERKPVPLLQSEYYIASPQVSPDRRWLAYASTESLRWEVYVAAFPTFAEKRQVSNNGGRRPMWRKDGKELFYLESTLDSGNIPGIDGKLMSVDVKYGPELETSVPKLLFPIPGRVEPAWDRYCVTGDGKKFIFLEPTAKTGKSFNIVLNWPTKPNR